MFQNSHICDSVESQRVSRNIRYNLLLHVTLMKCAICLRRQRNFEDGFLANLTLAHGMQHPFHKVLFLHTTAEPKIQLKSVIKTI